MVGRGKRVAAIVGVLLVAAVVGNYTLAKQTMEEMNDREGQGKTTPHGGEQDFESSKTWTGWAKERVTEGLGLKPNHDDDDDQQRGQDGQNIEQIVPGADQYTSRGTENAKDKAAEKAGEVKDRANNMKQKATEKAGDLKDTAAGKAAEMKDTTAGKAAETRDTACVTGDAANCVWEKDREAAAERVKDTKEKMNVAKGKAGETIGAAKGKVGETVDAAKGKVGETVDAAKETVAGAYETTKKKAAGRGRQDADEL